MKTTHLLIANGALFGLSAQAFNLLDVPQQFLGWAGHAVSTIGFGNTPVTSMLHRYAEEAGINPLWLPDSIRQYWVEADQYFPGDSEELEDNKDKFFARASSHMPLKNQRKKLYDFLTGKPKKVINKHSDWDFHVTDEENFPMRALRVKKTPASLGLDNVTQYSGYYDVESESNDGRHLFFWFFESRNDPKKDPIVVWLNGGPGCSSLMGLFYENGPVSIIDATETPKFNPHSWNTNASVIYLDQPAGVGFSYTDSGEAEVPDTRTASKDVYTFLSLFFQEFPEYKDLGLHISGESYAGHYIPGIATEILSHPERDFKFSSVLIGNGWTDTLHQVAGYEPMACGEGGHHSVLSEDQCERVNRTAARCQWADDACYRHLDRFRCIPALYTCDAVIDPYIKTGLNPYDIRKKCVGKLCYDNIDYYSNYLNRKEIQKAIGAEVEDYESCSDGVFNAFTYTGDGAKPFQFDVVQALEQGLSVLIYAGDKDYICNWVGQTLWLDALEWSGSDEWNSGKFHDWFTLKDNDPAGTYKVSGNLTFLRIYDAGHMVPYDQPTRASDMMFRWLHGKKNFA